MLMARLMFLYRLPIPTPSAKRAMLVFSIFVLFSQVVLYVASFFPDSHVTLVVAFLAILPSALSFGMMHYGVKDNPLHRTRGEKWGKECFNFSTNRQRQMWSELPKWIRRSIVIVSACLCLGFAIDCGILSQKGSSEFRDGAFWAGNYKTGMPECRITELEYWQLQGREARAMSSVGIALSGFPIVAFIWELRRKKEPSGSSL